MGIRFNKNYTNKDQFRIEGTKNVYHSENYSNDLEIDTVCVIGNGFDLQLGIISRYEDFLIYIYFVIFLPSQFQKFSAINSTKEYKNRLKDVYKKFCNFNNFKLDFKKVKRIRKLFLLAMDRTCDTDEDSRNSIVNNSFLFLLNSLIFQCDVPSYKDGRLEKRITPFFTLFDPEIRKGIFVVPKTSFLINTHNDFFDNTYAFVSLLLQNNVNDTLRVNGWLEVEELINCALTLDKSLLTKFSFDNVNRSKLEKYVLELNLNDNLINAKEFVNSIRNFTDEFCTFINLQQSKFLNKSNEDKEKIFSNLSTLLSKELSLYHTGIDAPFIENVDFSNIYRVLNYNYSDFADNLFLHATIQHVNGRCIDNTAIFGTNEEFSSLSKTNKFAIQLFKQTQRVLNHVSFVNYDRLVSSTRDELFNLIIYGHSCATADFDVIGKLLNHKNLNVAVVLCYDQDSFLTCYSNIRKGLTPDVFNKKLASSSSIKGRIFFLDRKPINR